MDALILALLCFLYVLLSWDAGSGQPPRPRKTP